MGRSCPFLSFLIWESRLRAWWRCSTLPGSPLAPWTQGIITYHRYIDSQLAVPLSVAGSENSRTTCRSVVFDQSAGSVWLTDLSCARMFGEPNYGNPSGPFLPYLAPEQVRGVFSPQALPSSLPFLNPQQYVVCFPCSCVASSSLDQ